MDSTKPLPPQKQGQAMFMTRTEMDPCGDSAPEAGHWFSPAAVRERIDAAVAAERERRHVNAVTLHEALQDVMDTGFTGGPQGKRALSALAKVAGSIAPDRHFQHEFEVTRVLVSPRERTDAEREVLARWIAEACGVLFSVEEEVEDGGEALRMLRERGQRLCRAVLVPPLPNV